MSQENVEIVRQVSDAFNRGDIEGCLAFYGEDVEIEDLMNAPDVPRVVRGIDGARELLTAWSEGFEQFRQDIVELIDLGDRVIGVSDYYGKSREGLTIQLRVADVVEIRDGKLVRVTFGYENRAKALEAVRLSEKATSQENLDLARRSIAAVNEAYAKDDIAPWRRQVETIFDPQVVLEAGDAFTEGEWHGKEGAVEFVANQMEVLKEMWMRLDEFIDVDENSFIVGITFGGNARHTDIPFEMHPFHLFTLRHGKILRWRVYLTREEALEAVGLTE